MVKKLNLLVSGPGLIGHQHARLVAEDPNLTLAAIVAPDAEENRKVSEEFNTKFYADFSQCLDSENIDGVIISSPNNYHFSQAIECLERGIPVLIEKPITDNVEDSRQIVERSKQLNVPVLVGHHRTYNPLLEPVRQFLNSSKFGNLVTFSGSALFYKPDHYFVDGPWRAEKGGGPILINLIHEIGIIRYFCGEINSVFAIASNKTRNFVVEDSVVITFEFKNGGLGSFVLSDTAASDKSWELTTGENPAYPNSLDSSCYHFAGTNGSIDFPTMVAKFYDSSENASWWKDFQKETLARPKGDSLRLQIEHFTRVIRDGEQPKVTAFDGHMNLVVVDAIIQSIEQKRIIDVDSSLIEKDS